MQTLVAGLQTAFELGTSVPERKFNYKGTDKSSYVGTYGTVTRNADAITSGNCTPQIINTDQSWNAILASPQTHIIPGATISTLQIGYTAIGFMTLFTGRLESVNFSDVDNVGLSFRDKISDFTKKTIGSSMIPADYYSSASYTVFSNANWSSGRNPADIIWHILTYWGGLDSTESSANVDIDWDKFSEFRIILGAIGYLVQAKFQGQTIATALKEFCELTLSTIFSEADGKIVCRYWLGSETADIQTYTSAKWNELPVVNMDRSEIINRYEVSYGLTFTQMDTGTSTLGDLSFIQDNSKTWTVNAYKGKYVHILTGTGVSQTRYISANTGITLIVAPDFSISPGIGDTFEILDYDNSTFSGSYLNEDATSKSNYGTFVKTISSTNVWFKDSASADGLGQRALLANKDPIQNVSFTSKLFAYRQQLWDALKLTESFYSWTDQGFRIDGLSFQVDTGEVTIDGRLSDLHNYLILDHATYGKLDYGNCLA
jgi:hypothetical protein